MYKPFERISAALSVDNIKYATTLLDLYISEQMYVLDAGGNCDIEGIKRVLKLFNISLDESCTEENVAVIDRWLPCVKWYIEEGGQKTWIRITKNGRRIQKPKAQTNSRKDFSKLPKDTQKKIINFRKRNNPSTRK